MGRRPGNTRVTRDRKAAEILAHTVDGAAIHWMYSSIPHDCPRDRPPRMSRMWAATWRTAAEHTATDPAGAPHRGGRVPRPRLRRRGTRDRLSRSRRKRRLPQFNHLFSSDAYSAGYDSYLWSEVMDSTDRAEAYRQFRGCDRGSITELRR